MSTERVASYLRDAHDLRDGVDNVQLTENWRLP